MRKGRKLEAQFRVQDAGAPVLVGAAGLCYSKQLTWLPLLDPASGAPLLELVTETVRAASPASPAPPAPAPPSRVRARR